MNHIKKILIAIALIVFVEAIIYFFFAFCNWDLFWMPNVGGFARFVYAFFSFFGCVSAIGFVLNEMED